MNNSGLLLDKVLDEIGLEGLDGITIESFWKRLSIRINLSFPLHENFCTQIWNFLVHQKSVLFYQLMEPRPLIKTYSRTEISDSAADIEYPFTVYKYNPIYLRNGKLRGSCQDYDTRKLINRADVINLTLKEIDEKWGKKFIIVGTQTLRESSILSNTLTNTADLRALAYCLLERIGRSRYNGEITYGRFSLCDMFVTTRFFHIRKNLIKQKLLMKQAYYEKFDDQSTMCSLLHLPRFYSEHKPKHMVLTEQVVDILKKQPNYMIDYTKLKLYFEENLHLTISKLLKLTIFQSFVQTDLKVSYRTLYPNASRSEWKMKNTPNEKQIRVIQLRDPNVDVNDVWPRDKSIDDEEDEPKFLYQTNLCIGVPLLQQTYNLVESKVTEGISNANIARYLGKTKLQTRVIIRNLERLNYITYYVKDQGRQRLRMYILMKYKQAKLIDVEKEIGCLNVDQAETTTNIEMIHINEDNIIEIDQKPMHIVAESSLEIQSQKDLNVPSVTVPETPVDSNTPIKESVKIITNIQLSEVSVKVEPIKKTPLFQNRKLITDKNMTLRMAKRMNLILKSVKNSIIISDIFHLVHIVNRAEKVEGYKDTMCKKSLYRLITKLSLERRILLFNVTITYGQRSKELMFLTDMHIDPNQSVFLAFVEKEKSNFLQKISNEKSRLIHLQKIATQNRLKEEEKKKNSLKKPKTPKPKVMVQKKSSLDNFTNYGFNPKFTRMRRLHEFLFYITYEHVEQCETIDQNRAIEHWSAIEPMVDFDELKTELSPIYTLGISWKMFVPPLISKGEQPLGWILLNEAYQCLPLSVFVKVYNINNLIPGLDDYLSHPIRRHYLVKYIPLEIQCPLIKSKKYVFSIDELMRRLCCIGLVQIGLQRFKLKDQRFVYINRNTRLLNTITSDPGYCLISIKDYTKTIYRFNNGDDLMRYWQELYKICINTRLGRRLRQSETVVKFWATRPELIKCMEVVPFDQAHERDTGDVPGDSLGAGGLDSSHYAHLLRNWTIKAIIRFSRPHSNKTKDESIVPIKYKRAIRRKELVPPGRPMPKRIFVPVKKTTQPIFKTGATRKEKFRLVCYDEIDKQAIRLMTKLRVNWSSEEDNAILFCKVAIMYICPNLRKQYISSTVVRDILHWKTNSIDKTSRACNRRMTYMMKKPHIASSVHLCFQEVKHNKEIARKFGSHIFKKLRQQFRMEDEFVRATKIFYVDLVYLLIKKFARISNNIFESKIFLLPDTIMAYKEMYMEKEEEYEHERLKYTVPETKNDIDITVLTTLVHSSMCCSLDKTSYSLQLYDVYKDYPEKILAAAMLKARNDQLISANKAANQSKISSNNLPLSSNPYHLSVSYQNQTMSTISYDILQEIYSTLKEINTKHSCNSIEFSKITAGRCFALTLLLQNKSIKLNIQFPHQMLVIDSTKYKEDDSYERIQFRFQELFKQIPSINIDNLCATNENVPKAIKKVTIISAEHEKIEYYMCPVEKLMKMDSFMYHFFCLLTHVNIKFNMEQLTISLNHCCSFNCVLSRPDPIIDIIDIIQTNSNTLRKIIIDEQIADCPESGIIDEYNILALLAVLISKELCTENRMEPSDIQSVLDTALEILESEPDKDMTWFSEHYKVDNDLSMNDEMSDMKSKQGGLYGFTNDISSEKIHKMHDFFYVSTCKIMLDYNKNEENELFEKILNKEAILEKIVSESIWNPKHADMDEFKNSMIEENFSDEDCDFGVKLLSHIQSKQEHGATNTELLNIFTKKQLVLKVIKILMKLNIVMRAGVIDFTYIHTKFISPWVITTYHIKRLEKETMNPVPYKLMKIGNSNKRKHSDDDQLPEKSGKLDNMDSPTKDGPSATILSSEPIAGPSTQPDYQSNTPNTQKTDHESELTKLRPNRFDKVTINQNDETSIYNQDRTKTRPMFFLRITPWIRVNGSLNRRVLDKWMGLILVYCISHPGATVIKVCRRYNFLQPVHIRMLLEILEEIKCIKLMVQAVEAPLNLWSTYETLNIECANEMDSNENTFIEVKPDAMTIMAIFINDKKYSADFI